MCFVRCFWEILFGVFENLQPVFLKRMNNSLLPSVSDNLCKKVFFPENGNDLRSFFAYTSTMCLLFLYICTCQQSIDDDVHWAGRSNWTGHYIMKSVTRCFVDWSSEITTRRLLTKDNAENDATGMLKMYPRCVREGSQCLQRTLIGCFSNTFVGITLFVSKQGLW